MKKLLLHNWPAKLVCLLLAMFIWALIKHIIITNSGAERPAAEEIRRSHP